ncbi:MAG: phosphatase PAP2 family protein [Bacteroidetes bacterium]|nr:phosphatase PAP2 family protein [Bacteroidota bacterium]
MRKLTAVATVVILVFGWNVAKCQNSGDTLREVSISTGWGSKADTVPRIDWSRGLPAYKQPFPYQSFILPASMIVYGVTAVNNHTLKSINGHVKEQVWEDMPHSKTTIDNYLMFTPAAAVYGLNALGIHGKHNLKDRTMIFLLANVFAQTTVFTVKGSAHELRPDGSDHLSFPSGHTAMAFLSAEFMRMEYKDVSPWYGIAGYAAATATGMLRIYNNKHWFSDVVAGAGVGIASTRLAYWLYPKMQHWLGKKGSDENGPVSMLMPTYQSGSFGFSYIKTF